MSERHLARHRSRLVGRSVNDAREGKFVCLDLDRLFVLTKLAGELEIQLGRRRRRRQRHRWGIARQLAIKVVQQNFARPLFKPRTCIAHSRGGSCADSFRARECVLVGTR